MGGAEIDEFATCAPVVQESSAGILRTAGRTEAFEEQPAGFPLLERTGAVGALREGGGDLPRRPTQRLYDSLCGGLPSGGDRDRARNVPVWHRDRDFSAIARYTHAARGDAIPSAEHFVQRAWR